jgi:nitric oxide reductase large subunit
MGVFGCTVTLIVFMQFGIWVALGCAILGFILNMPVEG